MLLALTPPQYKEAKQHAKQTVTAPVKVQTEVPKAAKKVKNAAPVPQQQVETENPVQKRNKKIPDWRQEPVRTLILALNLPLQPQN